MENINYEEFSKIKLRVVEILSAERVEGSEKLLKLEVDMGEPAPDGSGKQTRQIIAGIGKAYEPETLIGKKIIIVANLEPRKLMGLESQGMLLAASTENQGPILLIPDGNIDPGAEVR
ncbi:MAG TPA: methionine--tRNA ligase subunit beta [Candidatus Paceibacterota bacterium]|nr:methionine--tRNA ligase subunit beta [Candidatus Paceibacterota bacterium]